MVIEFYIAERGHYIVCVRLGDTGSISSISDRIEGGIQDGEETEQKCKKAEQECSINTSVTD